MAADKDLFAEENDMVAMSFGDHIEELRVRLILALLGLFVGVLFAFIPPLNLGWWVMTGMQEPAKEALKKFYAERAVTRATQADKEKKTEPFAVEIDAADLSKALTLILPDYKAPPEDRLKDKKIPLTMTFRESSLITTVARTSEPKSALVALAPLEVFMIFFSVCMVTGLVFSSPWVFYQVWAFIAAGLYRHERHYVKKYLPFSLGLFLGGVFLCYFLVLPYTLSFLLEFNVWLGVEPTLQISEWMSFATIMPLVFGACFQTPLVMMLLSRLGIVSVTQFREKRKYAILIMVVIAAVITPTGDPFTLALLAVPMIALYELGILMVRKPVKTDAAATVGG